MLTRLHVQTDKGEIFSFLLDIGQREYILLKLTTEEEEEEEEEEKKEKNKKEEKS